VKKLSNTFVQNIITVLIILYIMAKSVRKIIRIDEEICNGCGECIIGCPEQAIQLVETPNGPRARLVKDIYCDGLGACLGTCPTGALTIEERSSDPYDDHATLARIKELAPEMMDIHAKHIEKHAGELAITPEHPKAGTHSNYKAQGFTGCPSAQTMHWTGTESHSKSSARLESDLRQWPVQLHLVAPSAPYFQNADLAFIADCVPFCYPNFHQDLLKGKAIAVCCPKLDDVQDYIPKIAQIIKTAHPKSIQVVHMTVPCCFGLKKIVEEAIKLAGSNIPLDEVVIGIKGEKKEVC
jgi:ferredoxin